MKKYNTIINENKNMYIDLKQFMLDCLDEEKEKKLYNQVKKYDGDFYEYNETTSLFWEIIEFLNDDYYQNKGVPYSVVDECYTEWTDLDHSCEHNILIIKRKSDNQLFGVKYENPAHDSRHLFNNKDGVPTPFLPIKKKEVITYEYKF